MNTENILWVPLKIQIFKQDKARAKNIDAAYGLYVRKYDFLEVPLTIKGIKHD